MAELLVGRGGFRRPGGVLQELQLLEDGHGLAAERRAVGDGPEQALEGDEGAAHARDLRDLQAERNEKNMGSCKVCEGKEIQTTTLKDILKEVKHINYLKIDCEGCEYEMLDTIVKKSSQIDFIAMELHQGNHANFLKKLETKYKVKIQPSKAAGCWIVYADRIDWEG